MHIALAAEDQLESLVDLLCELNAHYNPQKPADRTVAREHVVKNLLSSTSSQRLVLAFRSDRAVIGFAAISLVYSLVDPQPELRGQCQLKELYVLASERSSGAGQALMRWIAAFAILNNCHRIDWPVKASNTRGIAFYESLGATRIADRLSYRLCGPALSALARSPAPSAHER